MAFLLVLQCFLLAVTLLVMLIICSGPDTWHARKKARELTKAFRDKHDILGYSTVLLQETDAQTVIRQLATPSLFAPKRFIRCDGLFSDLKIAEIRQVAKRLLDDADQTILLSVEEEPLPQKTVEALAEVKFVAYPFPAMMGKSFVDWCKEYAKTLAVSVEKAQQIADGFAGDVWQAALEIEKASANPNAPLASSMEIDPSVFEAADSFVRQKSWREDVSQLETEAVMATFLSQTRAAIRVKDRATDGLHPYVAKKLSGVKPGPFPLMLRRLLRAHAAVRTGLTVGEEAETLF